jgi:hypothetical protein
MAAVLLALDLAWRWYNHRWKNSPFENDQAYQSSSATSNNSKDAIRNGKLAKL